MLMVGDWVKTTFWGDKPVILIVEEIGEYRFSQTNIKITASKDGRTLTADSGWFTLSFRPKSKRDANLLDFL